MSFSSLGLSAPLLQAIDELGYQQATDIQRQAIGPILAGNDVLACAPTGSGKTASFILPILENFNRDRRLRGKRIRALVLSPTRELAQQIDANIKAYAKHLSLSSMAMVGGVAEAPQKQQLAQGVDIVVATPGRLLDLAYQRALYFDELEVLVLDEADRMLDMGFIEDIEKIIGKLPYQRQNLLFSATINPQVRWLASQLHEDFAEQACEITLERSRQENPIEQWLISVDKHMKSALLSHLIQAGQWQQALIFIETKHGAAKLVSQLGKRGIKADAIHSGKSQASREKILADFKNGQLKFLIATGIAARGLDISGLERVVNYDLPFPAQDYIHRIGRTGRAGHKGEAISLVSKDNFKNLCAIESLLGHLLERREVAGFPVNKAVPISILNYVPKAKRNKH